MPYSFGYQLDPCYIKPIKIVQENKLAKQIIWAKTLHSVITEQEDKSHSSDNNKSKANKGKRNNKFRLQLN